MATERTLAIKKWRLPNYKASDDYRSETARRGTFEITAEIHAFGNQEPYFALTGWYKGPDREWGGCCHEEIAHAMPGLEKYIKWHLCGTNGPMHYLSNTLYLAGNRDYNGRAAGDVSSTERGVRFGNSPITYRVKAHQGAFWQWLDAGEWRADLGNMQVIAVEHEKGKPGDFEYGPHYTLTGYDPCKWHECPFTDRTAAEEFLAAMQTCQMELVVVPVAWSNGKARELDAARRAAIWPDATNEELSVERDVLKAVLIARLPALLDAFEADMLELFGDQIKFEKRQEVTD